MDEKLSQILEFVVLSSNIFGQSPYKWDAVKQKLRNANTMQWRMSIPCVHLNLFAALSVLLMSVSTQKLLVLIVETIFAFSLTFHYNVFFTFLVFGHQFLNVVNAFVISLQRLEGKIYFFQICGYIAKILSVFVLDELCRLDEITTQKGRPPRTWHRFCIFYIRFNQLTAISSAIGGGIFVFTYFTDLVMPLRAFLELSILFTLWYLPILVGFTVLIAMYVYWTLVVFSGSIFIIFVYWSLAVLSELKRIKVNSSHLPSITARKLVFAISCYRQLQIDVLLMNEITGGYLLIVLTNSLTLISTASLTLYIGYHHQLDIQTLLTTALAMLLSLLCLVLLYYKFGDFNESSKKFSSMLQRNIKHGILRAEDKTLLTKYAYSLHPLKMDLGSFGYFKKPNSLRILTKILAYSVKGVMISKKIY